MPKQKRSEDQVRKDLDLNSKAENDINRFLGEKMQDNELGRNNTVRRPEWESFGIDTQKHFNEQEAINQEMDRRSYRQQDT